MRVLFCWNTAATFNSVADWLIDNGHDARIIMRESLDLGDCTKTHRAGIVVDTPNDYYREVIHQIREFKPTHIHVSSSIKCLLISRILAPRTPIIFSYHGTDIRGREKAHKETSVADYVTVTTPDLARYGKWIDRPSDPIFYYRGGRVQNTALMLYNGNFILDQRELAKEWCRERNISLTILDRTDPNYKMIQYIDMPEVYSKYEYYLDFKGFIGKQFALSKAAIEAFQCGCEVFHDSDLNNPLNNIKLSGVDEYIELYIRLQRNGLFTGIKRFIKSALYLINLSKHL